MSRYDEIYRSLDGMTALAAAGETAMCKLRDERDTAFVKRIVATYLMMAERHRRIDGVARGGPTEGDPDRPYCKPDQSCCDFCCGN